MRPSALLVLLPVTSLALVVAIGVGACDDSTGLNSRTPFESDPPKGVSVPGLTFGGECRGDVYTPAGVGWAVCEGDKWGFTEGDPASDGYLELPDPNDAGPELDAYPDEDANGQAQQQGDQGGGQFGTGQ